jgi:hypothetical protein
MKTMRREVNQMAYDVSEYRQLTMGPESIKKVALWPRILTQEEIERIKKEEAERDEAERQRNELAQAEAAQVATKAPPGKGGK